MRDASVIAIAFQHWQIEGTMYGLVNKSIKELVVQNFGEAQWAAITAKAELDVDVFISNEGYPDEVTYRLINAAAEVLGLPAEEILIAFGEHWILNTAMAHYCPMMKSGGRTLKDFLLHLPNFHTRVALIFPKLQPPHFECSDVTDSSLKLHYRTHRPGLTAFVIGLVQGLGKMYETPTVVTHIADPTGEVGHDVFAVSWAVPPE